MEDGLVLTAEEFNKLSNYESLNPYCNGRWSRTLCMSVIILS